MNPLEITLLVIGVITILISCLLVDRSQKNAIPAGQPVSTDFKLTEDDKKKLLEKMDDMLSDLSEETVVRTDDTLSKLSNEKIIAVNDFSEQVLEKIKRNHEEVVFLYNMLNDKEKELKAAVKEIDSSKKKVQDILDSKANSDKAQAEKAQTLKTAKLPSQGRTAVTDSQAEKPVKAINPQPEIPYGVPVQSDLSSNNNSQILSLYSQGKTIIEISKLLGLGQGEVKLVIDLFKGKK